MENKKNKDLINGELFYYETKEEADVDKAIVALLKSQNIAVSRSEIAYVIKFLFRTLGVKSAWASD